MWSILPESKANTDPYMETVPYIGFAPNQECPWSMSYKD